VQAERGLLDDSFSLHQRCLKQYRATVGNNHHRTADACVKVADHFVRIGEYESALYVSELTLSYPFPILNRGASPNTRAIGPS